MASVTTFATLKSELLASLGRAPADPVYQMVTRDINRDLRLLVMIKTVALTEDETMVLPTDFLEVESVYRDSDPRYALRPVPPQSIHRTFDSSGTPREYAIVDDEGVKKMLLNPAPAGSALIRVRYYAAFDELSADEDTDDMITVYPDVYIYGALYHHAMLTGDPRLQTWQAAYMEAKRAARASDARNRYGGVPLEPTVVTTP